MSGTKKKRKGRGPDRAMRMPMRVTEKKLAANRRNAAKPKPGKITHDEYAAIQELKRSARREAFPELMRKTIDEVCGGRTWGHPAFEAAAYFLADRCGLPKETVQDLKLQAGVVPTIRFEIVRPESPSE